MTHKMTHKISIALTALCLSGCMHHEMPQAERGRLNQMTCRALETDMSHTYWKHSDLSSHRDHANRMNLFKGLGRLFGPGDEEYKNLKQLEEHHNNVATVYNEKKCGAYQSMIKTHVP